MTDIEETENISDSNPEDAGDEEYYNTEELDLEETDMPEGAFGASSRTWPILKKVIAYFPGHSHVYITSTTGGRHAIGSYHHKGQAADVGSASQSYKDQLAAWLYKYASHITELIHSRSGDRSGWYVKNGKKVGHGYYGKITTRAHVNHVHLAVASVSQANALLAAVKRDSAHAHARPLLKSPSTNPAVKTLQTRLVARGYKVSVDGSFGPATVAAVKAFQKSKGLPADGIVGSRTWAALG